MDQLFVQSLLLGLLQGGLYDLQPGRMGEDCLVLNVWTSSLDPHANRPVMVHLHGGGWYSGSDISASMKLLAAAAC